jgi:transposase-like protein
MPPKPSRGKSIHRLTKWLPFQQSVVGVCLNLREVTALWRFKVRRQFGRRGPPASSIRRWYEQFRDRGCICHQGKGRAARPSVTKETVDRVRESFVLSPRKSVSRASRELQVPESTVRKILRKRLQLHPYKLQLIQRLKPNDPAKRLAFCEEVLGMMERDEGLSKRIIF